jgi:porin
MKAHTLLLAGAAVVALPDIALADFRDAGVTFNASYMGEAAASLSGGDEHAGRYTQQIELETLLDMEHIANIPDARLQMTLNYRSGRSLSKDVLHNQFSVQELYSDPSAQILRLSQFNWLQQFADRRVTVQVGWSPVGNNFARLASFCKFQSFVICGHANANTVNGGSQNGPISQWGARIKVWPTENFYVNTGVYRNNPDGGTDGGFDLSFDHDGNYYPIELGWKRSEGAPRGSIAIGGYYNSANTPDVYYDANHDPAGLTGLPFLLHSGRYGGYVMGEQVIHQPDPQNPARELSILGIAGMGDNATARFRQFAIAGAVYQGPLASRPDDFVSFMVAWARTNPRLSEFQRDRKQVRPDSSSAQTSETLIELGLGVQATPALLLQPNLQYIVQPGGNDDRSDALVLGLHFSVNF